MSGSGLSGSQNAESLSPPSHITSLHTLHAQAVSRHPSTRDIGGQIRFLEDGFSVVRLASMHNVSSHQACPYSQTHLHFDSAKCILEQLCLAVS